MIPIQAGQSLENVADEDVHFDQGFPSIAVGPYGFYRPDFSDEDDDADEDENGDDDDDIWKPVPVSNRCHTLEMLPCV